MQVEALEALEHGRAITVYIDRQHGEPWKVTVPRMATIHKLKVALKHHVALSLVSY